jgi:hypothetical protein
MYKYLDYLPEYLREIKEFQALDGCVNPKMEELMQRTNQVYSNRFILTADSDTISRWEKILKIIPLQNFSLGSRRLKVFQRKSEKIPYTFAMLSQYLSQLFKNVTIERDFSKRELHVVIQMDEDTQVDNLYSALRAMLPANMLIRITLQSTMTAQTYIGASMTSFAEETLNGDFLTVLPANHIKVGGALTDYKMEAIS